MEDFRENSFDESGCFLKEDNETDVKIQMEKIIDKVFRKPKVHGFNAKLHLYLTLKMSDINYC